MGGELRIRLANELWWTTIKYENALKWESFEVSWMDREVTIVKVNNTAMEMVTDDYKKLQADRAFRSKFKLKKHSF